MKYIIIFIFTFIVFSAFGQQKIIIKEQNNTKKTISGRDRAKSKEPKIIYGEEKTLKDIEVMKPPDPSTESDTKHDENYIYSIYEIEIKPEFSRNSKLFPLFISENFKYSDEMKINQVKGEILSSFVVEIDGSLSNIKIQHGLGHGTEIEALRVLSIMPKWQSAMTNMKNVRCLFTLPINIDATKQ